MHDIYDPPPALEQEWTPPRRGAADLHDGRPVLPCRAVRLLFSAAVLAWHSEPELAIATAAAGCAGDPGKLAHRGGLPASLPAIGTQTRWTIFLAALIPWLVGLGITVTVMLSLFWVSDLIS